MMQDVDSDGNGVHDDGTTRNDVHDFVHDVDSRDEDHDRCDPHEHIKKKKTLMMIMLIVAFDDHNTDAGCR